eukprot:m.175135 g.175135  ORF g.175135 m.175135 type:complete len:202 (+) comp31801_c0_seq1:75-680(+)
MSYLSMLGIAILVTVVDGETPAACMAPEEWEGRIVVIDPTNIDDGTREFEHSYDAVHRRKFYRERVIGEPVANRSYVIRIELFEYQGGVFFEIDEITKKCTKGRITGEFEVARVADGATFDSEYIVGSSAFEEGSVTVTSWQKETTQEFWQGVFTKQDCIPVRVSTSDKEDQTKFRTIEYFDITLGIHEPRVFSPPASCPI